MASVVQHSELSIVNLQWLGQSGMKAVMNACCVVGSPPPKQMPPPVVLEVDIVHLHHLVEFQWRDPVYAGRQGVGVAAVAVAAHIVVAAVVEAIPALQRAAHHCDQGGDALAVGSHA